MATKRLIEKLTTLLEARLDGFRPGLLSGHRNARVTGYIVSSAFEGMDFGDRQAMLERVLQDLLGQGELSETEYAQVGPVIAMTPAEADIGDIGAAETGGARPKKRAG